MHSVKTSETTRELGKPQDWDDSRMSCDTLPIKDGVIAGIPAMTSVWQFTDAERAMVAAGMAIHLTVLGHTHPPVMLQVVMDSGILGDET